LTEASHGGTETVAKPETAAGKHARPLLATMAARMLPGAWLKKLRSYRNVETARRPLYLKLRLLDVVGRGRGKRRASSSARHILFVCFGNRMRSPMCEALMRRALGAELRHFTVRSAGLHAVPGTAAHAWALAAAREFGLSLDDYRAQSLTADMVQEADAIFAMDYQNQVDLLSAYPAAGQKIFMLGAYVGRGQRHLEIADPYYGTPEQTRNCYQLLERCVHEFAADVLQDLNNKAADESARVACDANLDS
jgi:protein-tyrosine-phosphatase